MSSQFAGQTVFEAPHVSLANYGATAGWRIGLRFELVCVRNANLKKKA